MRIVIKKIIQYITYFFSGVIFSLLFNFTSLVKLLNLNSYHLLLILVLIAFITFLYKSYYFTDSESHKEVLKIYRIFINLMVASIFFLLGNEAIINEQEVVFDIFIDSIGIGIILLFTLILYFLPTKKNRNNDIPRIYKSREPLLNILNEYLEIMDSFSIIGDWGIGKTVLIKNFFYNSDYSFKNEYELIYIDSSIYSNNKNIIEKLQNEIDVLLEKYNIMKNKNTFTEEIFLEINTFIKNLYRLIFPLKSAYEIRESLEVKTKFINKKVVLCLDNLERIGDRSQIIKLFAIISELLPKNIKIMYVYDEKEMINIFDKDPKKFVNYMSKYTFNKIEVKDVKIKEILDFHNNLDIQNTIKEMHDKISNANLITNSIKLLKDEIPYQYYDGIDDFLENIRKDFKKLQNSILEKLNNPRYIENLISYLKTENQNINIKNLKYKCEYKLVRDFFQSMTLESMKVISDFSILDFKTFELALLGKKENISDRKLSFEQIEKLFFAFLFKVDLNGKSYKYIAEQNIYFEKFFYSYKNKENTTFYKDIEDLEKDRNKNFIKILELRHILEPKEFCKNVEENLIITEDTNYIISTDDELRRLILLQGLDEISHLILPYVVIDKNGQYKDGSVKLECKGYLDILIKRYVFDSRYILNLLQLNLPLENLRKYFEKPIGDFFTILTKQFKIEEENWLEQLLEQLSLILEDNKEIIKELNNYENTKKSIDTLERIGNLKTRIKELSSKKEKIDISDKIFSLRNKYQILNNIKIEENNFIINHNQYFDEIIINSKNIDDYINYLKSKLETNQDKENIEFLLIELIKFKNILGKENENFYIN
ncbi:hypothetical protein [Cetobacterium ceti]